MNSCKTQKNFWRSEKFFLTHKKLDFFLQSFQKENVFAYNSQHFSVDVPPKAATLVTTVQNYTVQEEKQTKFLKKSKLKDFEVDCLFFAKRNISTG